MDDDISLSQSKDLVIRAFVAAKRSGRNDWHRMTIAVLKNRMLAMSANAFTERTLGFGRFLDFVLSMPELLELDSSTVPPSVTLVDRDSVEPEARITDPGARIRADLWNAIVDYGSGCEWVWNSDSGQARERVGGDPSPILPSLTPDLSKEIRSSFVSSLTPPPALSEWVDRNGGAFELPSELRGPWTAFFKEAVYQRLVGFFSSNDISPPSDLLQFHKRPSSQTSSESSELREFVLRVVREMNSQELASLSLPSAAVFRASRGLVAR